MRIDKQDDGWWIVGVPPYSVDGVTYTSCGPYPTKAQALADKRGLDDFFRRHPNYTAASPAVQESEVSTAVVQESVVQESEVSSTKAAGHWLVKSLLFKSQRLTGARHVKSSPGQDRLPGFD